MENNSNRKWYFYSATYGEKKSESDPMFKKQNVATPNSQLT